MTLLLFTLKFLDGNMDAELVEMMATTSHALIVHPQFISSLDNDPPPTTPTPDWLQKIPRECLICIASHLSAVDLANLALCNRELRKMAADEKIWKFLCCRKFSVPIRKNPPSSWLALYKFNHELFQSVLCCADEQQRRGSVSSGVLPLNLSRQGHLQLQSIRMT